MDKYTKILIGIVVLIYLNAAIFFFINIDNNDPDTNGLDLTKNPSAPILRFDSSDGDEDLESKIKLTKEGHKILEELGEGQVKIHNFTFDQKNSQIHTVLVSFKTIKILPKEICYEEKVTENITIDVPEMTGMSVREMMDDANTKGVKLPMALPDEALDQDLGDLQNQVNMPKKIKEEVTHYVTKCKTSDEIYLSSIFGTVDIMKNNEALSHYTLTFRKEERDASKHEFITVKKDIVLPKESGKYSLRVRIWDKLSGSLVSHKEEFIVE